MKSGWLKIVILISLAMIGFACGDDDFNDAGLVDFRLDLVTFKSFSQGEAVFENVNRTGDITTLVANGVDDPGLAKDHRVLMRYREKDGGQYSRQIEIYSITKIISDSLRVNKLPMTEYDLHELRLQSIWQTGEFINVRCQVEYTGKLRSFFLLMDGDTRDNEVVDCYLVHDLKGEEPLHWRDCYASFNIGYLMKRPTCKRIRVFLTDVVRPETECYIFEKE
ncbi:MAG: hypothetical protein J6X81_00020 [Muribaculaceae bacterium]|nr:hypothetical protein [Muribaculaceae bacterium]